MVSRVCGNAVGCGGRGGAGGYGFPPRPRRAGPQQHRHGARCCGIVDMDWQEAALVVVGVEQRELLMPVHDIDGVVDVQGDGTRRTRIAGAVDVDHGVGQAHDLAQIGCILPTRHGWLRAEIASAVGQAPAGELEARIGAQVVEVIAILVAAGDGEHAGAQDVSDAVCHERRIARVRDQSSQAGGDAVRRQRPRDRSPALRWRSRRCRLR